MGTDTLEDLRIMMIFQDLETAGRNTGQKSGNGSSEQNDKSQLSPSKPKIMRHHEAVLRVSWVVLNCSNFFVNNVFVSIFSLSNRALGYFFCTVVHSLKVVAQIRAIQGELKIKTILTLIFKVVLIACRFHLTLTQYIIANNKSFYHQTTRQSEVTY